MGAPASGACRRCHRPACISSTIASLSSTPLNVLHDHICPCPYCRCQHVCIPLVSLLHLPWHWLKVGTGRLISCSCDALFFAALTLTCNPSCPSHVSAATYVPPVSPHRRAWSEDSPHNHPAPVLAAATSPPEAVATADAEPRAPMPSNPEPPNLNIPVP